MLQASKRLRTVVLQQLHCCCHHITVAYWIIPSSCKILHIFVRFIKSPKTLSCTQFHFHSNLSGATLLLCYINNKHGLSFWLHGLWFPQIFCSSWVDGGISAGLVSNHTFRQRNFRRSRFVYEESAEFKWVVTFVFFKTKQKMRAKYLSGVQVVVIVCFCRIVIDSWLVT